MNTPNTTNESDLRSAVADEPHSDSMLQDDAAIPEVLSRPIHSAEIRLATRPDRIDGIVIGTLTESPSGGLLVEYPQSAGLRSFVSTVSVRSGDVGRQVALAFESGDPTQPIVLGLIQPSPVVAEPEAPDDAQKVNVQADGETLTLTADREITLKCGRASLTLTRAGKVLLRGTYLLSRSSGVNKIKGGSVQIN